MSEGRVSIVVDEDRDTWTCQQWSIQGMWVPSSYVALVGGLFGRPRRCGAVMTIRWPRCLRCGSPRDRQDGGPVNGHRRPAGGAWFRFLHRRAA